MLSITPGNRPAANSVGPSRTPSLRADDAAKARSGSSPAPLVTDNDSVSKDLPVETCSACVRALDPTEETVLSMGKKWHKTCFVCSECKKEIRGPFVNNNGVPRCLSCQPKLQVCARCGFSSDSTFLCSFLTCSEKSIDGSFLQIGSNAYHAKCFTCHLCSNQMGTEEIFGYLVLLSIISFLCS